MRETRRLFSILLLATTGIVWAQQQPTPPVTGVAGVLGPVTPRVSQKPARELPVIAPVSPTTPPRFVPRRRPSVDLGKLPVPGPPDPLVQRAPGAARAPSLITSFEGVGYTGAVPPDTVGDVGPNHYVQMVNTVFQIWDKSGNILAGPSSINSLWTGAGGQCEAQNRGDPIVLYDPLADRWLISQFAFEIFSPPNPPSQCIAISTGADPTGTYHLYEFALLDFPDYPKFAVWPDAYYMGANSNPRAFAYDRIRMLAGNPATAHQFNVPAPGVHSMLVPSDLDGPTAPPSGALNTFYRFVDGDLFGGDDRLELFELDPDFTTPANATFTGPTDLPVAAFNSLCDFLSFDCIDQKDTTQQLDSITEWPMWRFQYRNFGSHETLVGNHAVEVDGVTGGNHAGVRWFELRRTGGAAGAWSIHQQGTFAPDGDSRWMGSIAMDVQGNMALGYSVSSASTFPSIRYTGRLAGDALGSMTQGEGTLVAGGGSQTGTNRWGDYSALSVDPADDCTFWYTNEYYSSTASFSWKTRIGSFKLCSDTAPVVEIQSPPDGSSINQSTLIGFLGTAIDVPDGDLTSGLSWESDLDGVIGSGGQFQTTLSVGSHTVTASVTDSDTNDGSDSIALTITAAGCSDHLSLNQEISNTQVHEAGVDLQTWAGFSVTGAGNATLRAGEAVILRDGFSVSPTAFLKAEIAAGICP